ncbi:hypothetical protein K461DRAFT_314693 [Myriangium duriaei CBS 260.36]|uniref:INO80 complex, subunit Ies4 n=1 Tax=Myriangium duriaei CBS 260.36 TaxID=1168546 RepID=A0A9P4MF67_9PEZI|nr:hypothetical protein K461DRAFT_314693 [Myriangium duriaei CBS 260.36]
MSATTTMPSTPTIKTPSRSSKNSKTVILRLKPDLLAKFSPIRKTPKISLTPSKQNDDKVSESNDTPAPSTVGGTEDTPDPEVGKKKGTPGTKPGPKRTSSAANLDALMKPKGRPGPKKKPRLADGTIDRSQDAPRTSNVGAAGANSHKLGPKANMGAINAGLRALDRSGKACRKWDRKGFNLKSFTGVAWSVGSWTAPVRDSSTFSGDVKSDTSSTADVKPTMESSAVPSDSSHSGDLVPAPSNGIASSPAPIVV